MTKAQKEYKKENDDYVATTESKNKN